MSSLLEVADELYALPLEDFVTTRDARAKQLRVEDADLARRVRSLAKPATAAWVVNQLVRGDAEQVEQVLGVGEALREAQATMSAEDLRALTRQRRQLTAAVTQRARSLARERGVRVSEAVAARVEATLTAAMLDADCAAAVSSGLLVTELRSTGLADVDVAGLVAVPEGLGHVAAARAPTSRATAGGDDGPSPRLRAVPDPDAGAKARAAAEQTLTVTQERLDVARAEEDSARGEVEELAARGLQLQAEIDELRRRLAELEADTEHHDDELTDAEHAVAEAAAATREATAQRDAARAALERLPG